MRDAVAFAILIIVLLVRLPYFWRTQNEKA
jgi:hypothetical protein